MNGNMTHERCSELLLPYRAGDLSAEERREVDAHLLACADCRTELAGLTALKGGEPTPLVEVERARLHRRVASALGGARARSADVLPLETPRSGPPLVARWLGAVAAVALIVVAAGIASRVFENGAGDAGMGTEGGGGGALESAPEVDGPEPVFAGSAEELALSAADEAGEGEGAPQAAASEALRATGDLSAARLRRLARSYPLFPAFAEAYEPADAPELAADFLRLLAEQAPAGTGSQIEECGREVLEAVPSPILPVVAAPASYEGQRALLLGFVTGEAVFDRYTVWVWPRGSCERPLHSLLDSVPD